MKGEKIAVIFDDDVQAGVTYKAEFVGRRYNQDEYTYKLITPHYTAAGEISFAQVVPTLADPPDNL